MRTVDKESVLKARLGPFLKELSLETGEPALAAVIVIHWTDGTSAAASTMPLPRETLFTMMSRMSRSIVAHMESLRSQMRVRREESPLASRVIITESKSSDPKFSASDPKKENHS
jgi:hypothetical protein